MKLMLKILVFLMICSGVKAQTPSGTKTRYPGMWLSSKDTANATSADSIAMLANRADSSLRFRYSVGAPWKKIQFAPLSGNFLISSYNLSDVTNTTTARTNLGALGISDTSAMLATRLKISDTASMLSGYERNGYGVKYTDTASMLASRLKISDTTGMLSGYARSGNVVKYTDVGANNGVAGLDAGGKVPFSQLPASLYIYKGTWDASTNTPTLTNGSGTSGWVYQASVGGTVNFGAGAITFAAGDYVGYNGSIWQWSPGTSAVRSVNGLQGVVTITVTGTSNRITVSGGAGATPTIDISASYAGQTSIVTLGTITTGVWNGSAITNAYLANPSFYVGTTSITLGRASASQTLTGVSIDGNAATATTTSYWGVVPNSLNSPAEASGLTNLIGVHSNGYAYKFTVGAVQSWLGLGSNAYTSTSFLPLSGGTLTGSLVGTSITLSGALGTGGDLYIPNNFSLYGRNYGNSAWIQAIGINASEKISIDANAYGTVFGGSITAGSINGTNGIFSGSIVQTGTYPMNLAPMGGTYYSQGLYFATDMGSANHGIRIGGKYFGSGDTRLVVEVSTGTQGYGSNPAALTYIEVMNLSRTGAPTFANLAGSGNRIVYANASGTLGGMVIGSGLSFDGTTLSATGGTSGTVTGSGTSGYIPLWNSASDIGNSIMSQSGGAVKVSSNLTSSPFELNNTTISNYLFINSATGYEAMSRYYNPTAGNWYAGIRSSAGLGTTSSYHVYSSIFGADVLVLNVDGSSAFSSSVTVNGNLTATNALIANNYLSVSSTGTFGGSVTASSFSGAGTGLTGTASGLTAGAANVAYTWDSYSGVYSSGTIQYAVIFNSTASKFQSITVGQMQSWLGLGSYAYRSSGLAELSGASFTGNISTTGTITASGGGFNSDLTLKKIIAINPQTDIADKVTLIKHEWINKKSYGDGEYYGYGAQWIQSILPEAVYTNESTGKLAVNYTMVHSVILNEHTREINELKSEIITLKKMLNEIRH